MPPILINLVPPLTYMNIHSTYSSDLLADKPFVTFHSFKQRAISIFEEYDVPAPSDLRLSVIVTAALDARSLLFAAAMEMPDSLALGTSSTTSFSAAWGVRLLCKAGWAGPYVQLGHIVV